MPTSGSSSTLAFPYVTGTFILSCLSLLCLLQSFHKKKSNRTSTYLNNASECLLVSVDLEAPDAHDQLRSVIQSICPSCVFKSFGLLSKFFILGVAVFKSWELLFLNLWGCCFNLSALGLLLNLWGCCFKSLGLLFLNLWGCCLNSSSSSTASSTRAGEFFLRLGLCRGTPRV